MWENCTCLSEFLDIDLQLPSWLWDVLSRSGSREDSWYNEIESSKTNLWIAWDMKNSQASAERIVKILPSVLTAHWLNKINTNSFLQYSLTCHIYQETWVPVPPLNYSYRLGHLQIANKILLLVNSKNKSLSKRNPKQKKLPISRLVSMILTW